MIKLAVLLSGRGSNFIAIQERIERDNLPLSIELVISDHTHAGGLQYARTKGINTLAVVRDNFASKTEFNQAILDKVSQTDCNWAVLAGYMRLVNKHFIDYFNGQVLNIHPSLLPRHKGLNTHQSVLNAGDSHHGASVHLVTEELDDGPIIIQSKISVKPDDTTESLAKRVLQTEHQIYPQTLAWLAKKQLAYKNNQLYFNDTKLNTPILWEQD